MSIIVVYSFHSPSYLFIFYFKHFVFSEWRDIVKIGVVECSPNPDLCRDLEVTQIPTIRLFPPHSNNTILGEDFNKKGTAKAIRVNLVKRLKKYYMSQNKVEGTLNLKPITNIHDINKILSTDNPSKVVFVVLVFEDKDSIAGAELALDLSRTEQVRVLSVYSKNTSQFCEFGIKEGSDGAVVVDRNRRVVELQVDDLTRYSLNRETRKFLISRGINVSLDLPSSFVHLLDKIKEKLNITDISTAVFKRDLESAVRYSLMNEVALRKVISGAQLTALKKYLHVLIKYFPSSQNELRFLKELNSTAIGEKTQIRGKQFSEVCVRLGNKYKVFLSDQNWIGCMGSSPEFRGYPCSLWTLFHTLTVQEQVQDLDNVSATPVVLPAIVGYIKHFFTCSECVAHFVGMAETIAGTVTTKNDSVLWLWNAHNTVNKRLAGEESEDPAHKKIPFPSKAACPSCRTTNGTFDPAEVFSFLTKMYTHILYLHIDQYPSTTTPNPWNFSFNDFLGLFLSKHHV